jgi:catecholate siderophore receptor
VRTLGAGDRLGAMRVFALAILFGALPVRSVRAQERALEQTYSFDIVAAPLTSALEAFRGVTGWTLNIEADAMAGAASSRAVRGRMTAAEALRQLLLGTGLGFARTGSRAATLERQVLVLPGIRVEVESNRGYQADLTRTATRTETLLRDVPQSLNVVTGSVIADLKMSGLADLVRYVPGATMGQGEGNRDQPTLRGQGSTADFYVDGVRDDTEYFRDLYNVERVEVVKGSNALVFGRAAGGGGINRVMKQASWNPVREVRIEAGTHDRRRGVADVGTALSDRLAGRVVALYENSNSYREGLNLERYGITPTATLVLGSGTALRGTYEFFQDQRTADRGVPSFNGVPLGTDPSLFFGDADASHSDARVHTLSGTFEHQLRSDVLLRNHTRVSDYRKFYQNVFPGAVNEAGTQVSINAYNSRSERTNVFNQTDITGSMRTGRIKHVWLAGAEIGRQSSDAFRNTGYFNDSQTSVIVPVTAPTTSGTPITFRQSATDADARTTALVLAGWVQDQIEFSPNLLAIAGLRLENFELDYHNDRDDSDLSRSDQLISPRLGLVIKPADRWSVYASYSVSHLPGSGNQFSSLSITTQTLEPEKFATLEAGVKWDAQPGLSLAAALYRLDRTNTSAPDPADPTHTIQTGAQRSRGLELSATGQITPAWQTLLGYSFQDVEITSRTTSAQIGQVPAASPRHTLSFWNRYQVMSGLGLGVGILHQDEMFAAIDNTVTLPAFTRFDGALFIRVSERMHAQINVENVFDERYFAAAHNNNNITPGSPRSVVAGVTIRY